VHLKKYGRNSIRKRYKSISLACKKAVNEFVHNREASLINDGNLGQFYRYVNNKIAGANKIGVILDTNGNMISDDQGKADIFMRHFGSVLISSNNNIPANNTSHLGDNIKCSDVSFTSDVVRKVLTKLKPKPSKGPDGYSPKQLKHIADGICVPLSLIFLPRLLVVISPKFGIPQLLYLCSRKVFQIMLITIDLFH